MIRFLDKWHVGCFASLAKTEKSDVFARSAATKQVLKECRNIKRLLRFARKDGKERRHCEEGRDFVENSDVIASEAKQPLDVTTVSKGLPRRYAPRNDVAIINEAAMSPINQSIDSRDSY